MASQITSPTIVYSTVCSDAAQRKHQSSVSLAFMRGIHRWPVISPHKGPVTRKIWLRHYILAMYQMLNCFFFLFTMTLYIRVSTACVMSVTIIILIVKSFCRGWHYIEIIYSFGSLRLDNSTSIIVLMQAIYYYAINMYYLAINQSGSPRWFMVVRSA